VNTWRFCECSDIQEALIPGFIYLASVAMRKITWTGIRLFLPLRKCWDELSYFATDSQVVRLGIETFWDSCRV